MRIKEVVAEIDLAHVAVLGAAIAGLTVFLFSPAVFDDGDTFWHIATGNWILDHHAVPHADPFSFTAAGRPWQAHEWLADLIMALLYRSAGWVGIAILFGCVAALAGGLLAYGVSRYLGGLALISTVTGALLLSHNSLLARPHMMILPIVTGWTLLLLRAREQGKSPPLAAVLLLTLWANLHASYAFAFVIAGFIGLEALWECPPRGRWRVVRGWGVFAASSIIAVCLTPFGVKGLLFPFQVMSLSILPTIQEWLPVSFAHLGLVQLVLVLAAYALLSQGVRIRPFRLMLLLLLLVMSLQHIRQMIILAAVAPLLLAEPLTKSFEDSRPRPSGSNWSAPIAAIAVVGAVLIGLRVTQPLVRKDSPVAPITAVRSVGVKEVQLPVLNDYAMGGYLIFSGIKPYIDGRADMYGDQFVSDFMRLDRDAEATQLKHTLDQHHIAWTIFRPQSSIPGAMDRLPGWRRAYQDKFAVVHVRAAN